MKLYNLQKYAFTKNFFEGRELNISHQKSQGGIDQPKGQPRVIGTGSSSKTPKDPRVIGTGCPYKIKSLFWTLYCIVKGEVEYQLNQNNLFKLKNEFTMKCVESIKKEKVFMKQNKIRFHDVEASMLYEKDINLDTLRALVLFFKLNMIFVDNHKYYIFETNNEDSFCVIHKQKYTFRYEKGIDKEKALAENTTNKLFMENSRHSLKAMGSYKVDELKEFAGKLGITIVNSDNKKKTKKELYDEIIMKID